MNLDSLSLALSQISYLVDNLTKKNYRASQQEIQHSLKPSPHLFAQLSKVIKLSKVQEVIFGLALLNSFSSDLRGFAAQFIKQKLPDLLRSYIDADVSGNQEGGFQDIAIEVLHLLLSHLLFGQKGAFGNPSLDFKVVTYELDHPGFQIRDSKGLHIVVFGIQRGLGMEVFPVNAIYRPWKHAEGQLSFIQHSLINPEIFCFADYPCHTVATDILKAPPEDDNREIATW
ncbi:ccr4-not transcription complex subunit 1 isoform x2 [Limosa lapponica baueri]|uniref:Ccr4-not transcription complex subunit 1 isoform x2 n=1 Tax=Limosa lapponica baueri TaxID=1758121 RepID=A0A2I0TAJ6_LIMLA|nr:ccr4-not transcription complex subunit 1 isoform x2 [Limosa lapponica baueri]